MDQASLEALQSPAGQLALAESMALHPDESSYLRCFTQVSKRHPGELARAALTTALLRRRAASKFSRAAEMYFEREALEQSSSEVVATYRARRFVGLGLVADLCCGLGGDAIALAERGEVVAVDLDSLRLRLCELNLEAYQRRERVRLIEGDVLKVDLAGLAAVFVDPDRRVAGRRQLSLAMCQPPLLDVLARFPAALPLAAKLAPGVPWAELARLGGEAEFISVAGELKECVLWRGSFRTTARRAMLLPGGDTLAAEHPAPSSACAPPGRYLHDPDPAILRAGLVTDLAHRLNAWQLDPQIAYLSSDHATNTPFARLHLIEAALPFHLQRLRVLLRTRHIGRVQIQRRGSAIDPDDLARKLRLKGDESRTLVLTQVEGRPWVLVTVPQATRQ